MKKSLFVGLYIAAFAGILTSCKNEVIQDTRQIAGQDNTVSFDAFMREAVTKGVIVEKSKIIGDASGNAGVGIGVFAFYQPAVAGSKVSFNTHKFAVPDFMYNQQVTPTTAGSVGSWTYTPTKYWPNNTNDQVSFFAYTPYNENTTWEDMGITTDVTGSILKTSFPIYSEKSAMKDILWADPQLNRTKPATVGTAISFGFRHILSRLSLEIGVEVDKASGEASAWNDSNTDIIVNSIEFKGLAETYCYSKAVGTSADAVWTPEGSQDIRLTQADFRNYTIQATDRAATPANVWNQAYWSGVSEASYYKELLSKEDGKTSYLFLAPQSFEDGVKNVVINYTVLTKEDWSTSGLGANDSKIVNTIECEMHDIIPALESGKAYTIKFLIGMQSVKIAATIEDWGDVSEHYVGVPSNQGGSEGGGPVGGGLGDIGKTDGSW